MYTILLDTSTHVEYTSGMSSTHPFGNAPDHAIGHLPSHRLRWFDSTASWEADRKAKRAAGAGEIGGSLVAQILGLRPFGQTPWSAWLKLTGQEPPRTEAEQEILGEGIRWEPVVCDEYARCGAATAVWRPAPGVLQVVGKEPWVVVTPDALAQGTVEFVNITATEFTLEKEADVWGVVELKTDRESSHWGKEPSVIERWDDEAAKLVPPMYACQALLLMYAMELPFCDLAALVCRSWGFPELRWHRLMRDEAQERLLIDTLGEWREKHIVQGVPPDIDDSAACAGWLAKKHPGRPDRKTLRPATDVEEAQIHEWIYAASRADEAKSEQDRRRNELVALLGDDYGWKLRNGKVICYSNPGRKSIDWKALEERFPEARELIKHGDPYKVLKSYVK